MIVCLTKLCRKSATKEENRKSKVSSIISKFEFLWQLPYIQLIRHIMLWNELRKAILKRESIHKLCNIKGISLLTIIRTQKLVNLEQSWHVSKIQQELEKTVLSEKAIVFILKQWKEKHGETIFDGSLENELEEIIEDSKRKSNDAVILIDSKIQTFRIYQTFGDEIPSFKYPAG